MKVVQSMRQQIVQVLSGRSIHMFAKLANESSESREEEMKYKTAKEYYEYLLKFTKSDERGYIKFNPGNFTKMVRLAANEEDVTSIRDAFYNFLGHKQQFTNLQVDKYLLKAVELNATSPVHEILLNHNYLMYYPHPRVLHAIAQLYVTHNNIDALQELSKIFLQSHFLKLEPQTLQVMTDFAFENKNTPILLHSAQLSYRKNITSLTPHTINLLLAGLARHKLATSEGEDNAAQGRVESKFLSHIKKCSQSYHTIIGKAYLALASKDIDGALVNLANFHQVDQRKSSEILEDDKNLISDDTVTLEFFNLLGEVIAASHKPKYSQRLAKVTSDIELKQGKNAIHPTVSSLISQIVTQSEHIDVSPPPQEQTVKLEQEETKQE